MASHGKLSRSLGNIPLLVGIGSRKSQQSEGKTALNVSVTLVETKAILPTEAKIIYEDAAAVTSGPESSSSEETASYQSTDSDIDVDEGAESEAEIEEGAKVLMQMSESEYTESDESEEQIAIESNEITDDESDEEEECDRCAEIRIFYRNHFKKVNQQLKDLELEMKTLATENARLLAAQTTN